MKIALTSAVSAEAEGGSAAYARWLGNHLVSAGHDVCGVSRIHSDLTKGLKHGFYERRAEVQKKSLNGWETTFVRPRAGTKLATAKLLSLLTRKRTQSLAVSIYCWCYAKSIKRALPSDCQVVHHTGTGWDLFSFAAMRAARSVGATFSITPFVHPNSWGDSDVDVKLYSRADAVFVCTNFEHDYLKGLGVDCSRLVRTGMAPAVIPAGCAERFRSKHGLNDRIIVLFLARKQQYKGYHGLRQAIQLLISRFPNICLIAAGSDVDLPYPELPAANFVDLGSLGSSSSDLQEKADALSACDMYCMPSVAEAFGLVYVEAWSFKKPVIGGLAPAVKELISDGVDGFITSQSPDEIASKIALLASDLKLRERLGNAGFLKQQERYTWPAVVENHLHVWQNCLSAQFANKR